MYFRATGGFFERFINLCNLYGVNLWNVKNDGVNVYAFTTNEGYEKIKKVSGKSGMNVEIIKNGGLPVFLQRNKTRVGVCIGIALGVIVLTYYSLCIWNVEVVGLDSVNVKDFTETIENCGIKAGKFKSELDTEGIEKLLSGKYRNISWVSVNIFGSKVTVEVRETEESPEITDYSVPQNIVAGKSGTVTLVKGHSGTNVVKEGDNVLKGDVLISGVITNGDKSETLIKATGEVIADTLTDISFSAENSFNVFLIGECDNYYDFEFFGIKIPLYFKLPNKEKIGENKESLTGKKEVLPVSLCLKTLCDCTEEKISLSENEALLYALSGCVKEKRIECESIKLRSVKYKTDIRKNRVSVNCRADGTENIGKESPIYVEK